jgi:hypothetical protein
MRIGMISKNFVYWEKKRCSISSATSFNEKIVGRRRSLKKH